MRSYGEAAGRDAVQTIRDYQAAVAKRNRAEQRTTGDLSCEASAKRVLTNRNLRRARTALLVWGLEE